jgi:hypothetical protein
MGNTAFADVCRLSVADLHRRCIALEDERRCLEGTMDRDES